MLVLATRSGTPRPVPSGEPGPESPAVVDLITGDWRLCEEAAVATLLDLAARRVVTIEEIGPELSLVRLGRTGPPALTGYEQLVYDHVRTLATGGVVATGALAEGARHLGGWWKAFRKAVVAEARAAGLSRRRWSPAHHTLLGAAAALPAIAAAAAVWTHPLDGREPEVGAALGAAVIVFFGLGTVVEKLNGERGTAAGPAAAGRWLGVREQLAAGRSRTSPLPPSRSGAGRSPTPRRWGSPTGR